MRLFLLAASACLGFSCIVSAHALAGTGVDRPRDLTGNIRTDSGQIPGIGIISDVLGENFLKSAATDVPMDDNRHGILIAGTFVGNPN
jgi:hypothetical protein